MSNKLSGEIYRKCRSVLLNCDEFSENERVRAIFITNELKPFQAGLPEGSSRSERVDRIIDYLLPKQLQDGQQALLLFLKVLSARYDPEIRLHHELVSLVESFETTLKVRPSLMPEMYATAVKAIAFRREIQIALSKKYYSTIPAPSLATPIASYIVDNLPKIISNLLLEWREGKHKTLEEVEKKAQELISDWVKNDMEIEPILIEETVNWLDSVEGMLQARVATIYEDYKLQEPQFNLKTFDDEIEGQEISISKLDFMTDLSEPILLYLVVGLSEVLSMMLTGPMIFIFIISIVSGSFLLAAGLSPFILIGARLYTGPSETLTEKLEKLYKNKYRQIDVPMRFRKRISNEEIEKKSKEMSDKLFPEIERYLNDRVDFHPIKEQVIEKHVKPIIAKKIEEDALQIK